MATVEQVRAALHEVCDPCSLAAGTPVSIVDLGLVRDVAVDGGRVHVEIGVTGPGCTYTGHFAIAVRDVVGRLDGVRDVDVALDTTTLWDPSRISPSAQQSLDDRRARAVQLLGIRPRMWQEVTT